MIAFLRKFLSNWSKIFARSTKCQTLAAVSVRPTLCIGTDTVTLGYYASTQVDNHTQGHRQRFVIWPKKTKKRLGDQEHCPHLTQSSTLSLITEKLSQLKSSDKIQLILDDSFFHWVDVEAPQDIPPHEMDTIFTWALKEQGFAPLDDWLWDVWQSPTPERPNYQLIVIERQQVELYTERLQLSQSRIACVQPTAIASMGSGANMDTVEPSMPVPIAGPWLNRQQLNTVLVSLTGSEYAVNLLNNITRRTQRRFLLGTLELSAALGVVLFIVYSMWPQTPPSYLIPPTITLQSNPTVHPLLAHETLWQALQVADTNQVNLQQLDFRRGRWHIRLRGADLNSGQAWLDALSQALPPPWQVHPTSTTSSEHASVFEVEVSR